MNKNNRITFSQALIALFLMLAIGTVPAHVEGEEISKYSRKEWPHWSDLDRDCQNTRNEVLIRDGENILFKSWKDCRVLSGRWHTPYNGYLYHGLALKLDVDHIVPLKWAHAHGGWKWNKKEKRYFANDMDNLLTTSAKENRSKGAKGPTVWLPSDEDYHCEYIVRWDRVVEKYKLPKLHDSNKVCKSDKLYKETKSRIFKGK